MKTKISHGLLAGSLSAILFVAAAPAGPQDASGSPPLLPREREIALAVSAAPSQISGKADVYVLEAKGYVRVREGSNGFTCLVVRDFPQDLAPVCHDPEGTATVIPRLLREAELRALGKSPGQIREEINEGLRTGKYRVPGRIGLAYMLSTENKGYLPEIGHPVPVQPHVMLYAPYLRNADIGAEMPKGGDFPDYPFVISEGEFNAYIVMKIPDSDQPMPSAPVDPPIDNGLAASKNGVPALLPREREIAIARSAALPHVSEKATIMVLAQQGFIEARKGTNGFVCLVERDFDPRALFPVCYDPEGVRCIVPVSLRMAQLLRQGKKRAEIEDDIAKGFRSGRFQPPRRAGVAYMFSKQGRSLGENGKIAGFAPHAMFYAPYLRPAEIGAAPEADHRMVPRMPIVLEDGPESYIIVTLRH